MPRKKKTIHYLYKTTCNVTERYYIGMHSTNDLEDGYMGSGRRLRASIRKYGEENHTKEILEFFETRELLIEAEENAITPDMVGDPNCMNLMGGGTGGFISDENQKKRSIAGNDAFKKKMEDDEFRDVFKKKISDGVKNSYKNGRKGKNYFSWKGKKMSEETKKKMSISKKNKGMGKDNSQYGTCWIRKGKHGEEKKIKKEELDDYLSKGWERGRTLPTLVCNIGQKLKLKEDIIYEDINLTVKKGENCIVEDIKGYGFDIVTDKGIDLRFMNSQILDYFELIN